MRFVAVCEKSSHIQDIPWHIWVHRGKDSAGQGDAEPCRSKNLRFHKNSKLGEGLTALIVKCYGCGGSRSMTELVGKKSLQRDGLSCLGKQPWQGGDPKTCTQPLIAVQRGATGNYIAERISALDIPEERPESAQIADQIRGHVYFEKVAADNCGPQAQMVSEWIADELQTTKEVVLAVAVGDEPTSDDMLLDLKDGEWAAFLKKLPERRDPEEGIFVVDGRNLDEVEGPQHLLDLISGVGQVRRVREVRALQGFRRHEADAAFIKADIGPNQQRNPIYPAIELFGEGIFLRFDEEKLAAWESRPDVQARAAIVKQRRAALTWAANSSTTQSLDSSRCTRSPT